VAKFVQAHAKTHTDRGRGGRIGGDDVSIQSPRHFVFSLLKRDASLHSTHTRISMRPDTKGVKIGEQGRTVTHFAKSSRREQVRVAADEV
jgi:hypothetical protein